ncbi:uncharacterized protein [Miscanthus floridulus]|uniref:uncharacterized protein isoform X2 n=1 Tax=Miscanthus floridulus TaxID=154761 RepID=UPI00345ADD92
MRGWTPAMGASAALGAGAGASEQPGRRRRPGWPREAEERAGGRGSGPAGLAAWPPLAPRVPATRARVAPGTAAPPRGWAPAMGASASEQPGPASQPPFQSLRRLSWELIARWIFFIFIELKTMAKSSLAQGVLES